MSQISMKKGLWVYFDFEDHRIAVHVSAFSGKETVYVDDHPVSDQRNILSFTGKHTFDIDGQAYSVEIELQNPFSYKVEVRLKKGARTLQTHNAHLFASGKHSVWIVVGVFLGFVTLGAMTGYVFGKLVVGG